MKYIYALALLAVAACDLDGCSGCGPDAHVDGGTAGASSDEDAGDSDAGSDEDGGAQ